MKPSSISLIVGLSIPVLMVIGIALAIIIPGRSIHPQTDFVYALGQYPTATQIENGRQIQHSYSIKNGHITDSTLTVSPKVDNAPYLYQGQGIPRFFIHHTAADTNEEVSFDDIAKRTLSDDSVSPDGFTMTYGSSSGGMFPFYFEGQNDRASAYLSKNTASKKVTIITKGNDLPFSFVAWVTK